MSWNNQQKGEWDSSLMTIVMSLNNPIFMMKKKILSMILLATTSLSLIACGNKSYTDKNNANETNSNTTNSKVNYIGKMDNEPITSVSNIIPIDAKTDSPTKYLVVTANVNEANLSSVNPVEACEDYTKFYSLHHSDETKFTIEEYGDDQGPIFYIPGLINNTDGVYVSVNCSKCKETLDIDKAKTDINYFAETLDSYNYYYNVLASKRDTNEIVQYNELYIIGTKYKDYYVYDVLKFIDDYLIHFLFSVDNGTEINTDYVDDIINIISFEIKDSKDELDTSLVYYEDLVAKEIADKFNIYLKHPENIAEVVLEDCFNYIVVDDNANYITLHRLSITSFNEDMISKENLSLVDKYNDYEIYNKENSTAYWMVNKANKYVVKVECSKNFCKDKDSKTIAKELAKQLLGIE